MYKNDWSEYKNGEAYIEKLRARRPDAGPDAYNNLIQLNDLVPQPAFERHAPTPGGASANC